MSSVNHKEMLVGLDIGTSKVVAVVAEINDMNSKGAHRRAQKKFSLVNIYL